jgi:hypothetical protein
VGLIMATRVLTTGRSVVDGWDRLVHALATWSPAGTLRRIWAWFWPMAWPLRDRLLRLLLLPFWAGTDLAAPRLHRRFRTAAEPGPASRRLVGFLTGIYRRQMVVRLATMAARAVSLTLLVAIVWAGWAAADGPQVNGDGLIGLGAGSLILAMLFGLIFRPDLREIAVMLDRSFELSDRIATAVDHLSTSKAGAAGKPHVAYLQIAEATNTVAILGKHPALRIRAPVREIVLGTGFALIFLSLFLLRGTGSGLPATGNSAIPAFVAAKDRVAQQPAAQKPPDTTSDAPTVAEVQERAETSASAEEDLLTLADALDDNPLTSPIADSIRAGEYEQAAAQLEAIASQVSQLSPEARQELADRLDQAADDMTGEHPGLQDATDDAADGLRSDPQTAESSLKDLSEQIEATGKSIESQQELAEDMRDARQAESQGSSGSDTRPEPGDDQPGPSEGEQQIAGEGGDAAPGQESQQQGEQTGGSGSDGASDQGDSGNEGSSEGEGESGDALNPPGSSGQTGDPEQSGGPGSAQGGNGEVRGEIQPESGDGGGSSEESQVGGGAGDGTGEETERQSSDGSESEPGSAEEDSPDPNVLDGEAGSGDSSGEVTDSSHSSITLSRSPTESGLQTGGSSSSSSGSGSGAAAGTGSVDQGDVGTAGPDSNRVPLEYRRIVEDYFSEFP